MYLIKFQFLAIFCVFCLPFTWRIPHHRCTILSILIQFKTTRPQAYLLPPWKLLFFILQDVSWINSLGPSDTIWQQRSGSTLAQVMACCLTAPSHYLNQCWLIIIEVEWHSSKPKGKFTRDTSAINSLVQNKIWWPKFWLPNLVAFLAATKQLNEWYFPSVCPSVCLSVRHTFLPEASFGLRVLSSPLSVYLSVCVSVCVSITCLSAR